MNKATTLPTKNGFAKGLTIIGLVLGALFAGLPVVWMFAASYIEVLTNSEQLRYFFNSYLVAILVTLFTLIVGILAGYSFSRFKFRFKNTLNLIIIGVQSVPPITLMIPYFGLIVAFGLYNSYWALIFTYMVFTLPYAIIMMTGYFNTLPRELDEAVMIDGGSGRTILWRVLVPISLPGVVSVGIYTFMLAWNEFLFALTLTKTNDMRTVPIGIQLLMGQHSFEWNQMMSMSVLGSLPVLLLFLVFQRYFIAGMSAGSIKG
jgi:multiple sugar transport system permease protein